MPSKILHNPWFVPITDNHEIAKLTLFTFHYAGGSASAFRLWSQHLSPETEIIAAQYPGRENRFMEPALCDLRSIVTSLAQIFSAGFDKPFVFFGHSLGSFVSLELARELARKGYPSPQHLIVSGARAPHLPLNRKKIHHLPDAEFIFELSKYNGVPDEMLNNHELMSLFLPTIRADFTVSETYRFCEAPLLLCPITAFGGTEDPYVPLDNISGWARYTKSGFKEYHFNGDHFFFRKEAYLDVAGAINRIIEGRE